MRQGLIVLLSSAALSAASAAGAVGSDWSLQRTTNPSRSTQTELNSVSCPSKDSCLAVGDYLEGTRSQPTELLLAEHWNGTKWSLRTIHTEGARLVSVSCGSPKVCFAVGYYDQYTAYSEIDTMLAERWNGAEWSIEKVPIPAGTPDSALWGVSCTSKRACTAVGTYQQGTTNVPLAERWNGTRWSIQHTPTLTHSTFGSLAAVSCSSDRTCTAVGAYEKGMRSLTLAERWNGHKWSIQKTPNRIPHPTAVEGNWLNSVSCASKSSCTAVGGTQAKGSERGRMVAEYWNGTTWSLQRTPNAVKGHRIVRRFRASKSAPLGAG